MKRGKTRVGTFCPRTKNKHPLWLSARSVISDLKVIFTDLYLATRMPHKLISKKMDLPHSFPWGLALLVYAVQEFSSLWSTSEFLWTIIFLINIYSMENWWKGRPRKMKNKIPNKWIYWKVIFIFLKADVSVDSLPSSGFKRFNEENKQETLFSYLLQDCSNIIISCQNYQ